MQFLPLSRNQGCIPSSFQQNSRNDTGFLANSCFEAGKDGTILFKFRLNLGLNKKKHVIQHPARHPDQQLEWMIWIR